MANLVEIVIRFLSELSFKKIMSLVILISIFFLCILLFDRMTSTVSLNKIERSLTILERLNNLDTSKHPELTGIKDKLTEQLSSAITPKSLSTVLSKDVLLSPIDVIRTEFSSWGLWARLIASFTPWLLILIAAFHNVWKGEPNSIAVVVGTLLIGIIFALIGLLLPNIWWLSFIVYPIGHFSIFIGFVLLTISYQKNKIKRQQPTNKAQPTIPSAAQ